MQWCLKRTTSGRKRPYYEVLPRALDMAPADRSAADRLKGAELVAVDAAERAKRAERRKRQRADRARAKARRPDTAQASLKFAADELLELWKAGEHALVLAASKGTVRGMIRELVSTGQLSTCIKGKPRTLIAPRPLCRSDCDMLLTVGMDAVRHAVKPGGFDGRGSLAAYIKQQVWFAFSHHFEDPQSDFTAGISELPAEFKRLRTGSLDELIACHDDEGNADQIAQIDNLTADALPWTEEDSDWMRRVFEGDPQRLITPYGMNCSRLNDALRAAISKIRARELRAILNFLFTRSYDFSNRTAFLLQEYAKENGIMVETARARRDRALTEMRVHLERDWPGWRNHFHTRPERRKYT